MEFACRGEAFADKNSHYSLILTANASPLRHIAIFILVGKLLNPQSKQYGFSYSCIKKGGLAFI
jgi:hypothetical protein